MTDRTSTATQPLRRWRESVCSFFGSETVRKDELTRYNRGVCKRLPLKYRARNLLKAIRNAKLHNFCEIHPL